MQKGPPPRPLPTARKCSRGRRAERPGQGRMVAPGSRLMDLAAVSESNKSKARNIRRRRLAAALRQNLKRRKTQERARGAADAGGHSREADQQERGAGATDD